MDNNNKKHPIGCFLIRRRTKILTISIHRVICMCEVCTVVSVADLEARVMVEHGFESRRGRLFFFFFFFLFLFIQFYTIIRESRSTHSGTSKQCFCEQAAETKKHPGLPELHVSRA